MRKIDEGRLTIHMRNDLWVEYVPGGLKSELKVIGSMNKIFAKNF